MRNIVSTMIVFGLIFLLIVVGAYVFDKINGFEIIDKVDSSINNSIQTILDDNNTDNNVLKTDKNLNNLSNIHNGDNTSDNNTLENETMINDNYSRTINTIDKSDNISNHTTNSETDNKTDVNM